MVNWVIHLVRVCSVSCVVSKASRKGAGPSRPTWRIAFLAKEENFPQKMLN